MAICGWIPPRPWGTLIGIILLAVAVCKSTLTDGLIEKLDGAVAAAVARDVVKLFVELVDLAGDDDLVLSGVVVVDAEAEVSEVL